MPPSKRETRTLRNHQTPITQTQIESYLWGAATLRRLPAGTGGAGQGAGRHALAHPCECRRDRVGKEREMIAEVEIRRYAAQ